MPKAPPIHKTPGHRSKKYKQKQYDKRRGSPESRGYDARWRKYRKSFLSRYPWCTTCLEKDIIEAATVVDHIKAHKGDMVLFWQKGNHQGMCKTCHGIKTVKEDGGFGNAIK